MVRTKACTKQGKGRAERSRNGLTAFRKSAPSTREDVSKRHRKFKAKALPVAAAMINQTIIASSPEQRRIEKMRQIRALERHKIQRPTPLPSKSVKRRIFNIPVKKNAKKRKSDFNDQPKKTHKKRKSGGNSKQKSVSYDDLEAVFDATGDDVYNAQRRKFYKKLQTWKGDLVTVSRLSHAPIDLYHLWVEVKRRGGFDNVTETKSWLPIFKTMPQYSPKATSASFSLKRIYIKSLLDYDKDRINNGHEIDG